MQLFIESESPEIVVIPLVPIRIDFINFGVIKNLDESNQESPLIDGVSFVKSLLQRFGILWSRLFRDFNIKSGKFI